MRNTPPPKKNNHKSHETWYSYDGEISKQHDYILIEISIEIGERITNKTFANISSAVQNRDSILDLRITLKNDYFTNSIPEYCLYAIQKALINTEISQNDIGKSQSATLEAETYGQQVMKNPSDNH